MAELCLNLNVDVANNMTQGPSFSLDSITLRPCAAGGWRTENKRREKSRPGCVRAAMSLWCAAHGSIY